MKEEFDKKPGENQGKVKNRVLPSSSAASGLSSCLARCFRLGKRRRGDADLQFPETIEEEEAATCLETSKVCISREDGEALPCIVDWSITLFSPPLAPSALLITHRFEPALLILPKP
ncbi:hypothetical protein CSUI_000226 [Cystoisospora suis]|uniref:Uncharacterized protein n=1 Tax=Cystoisospora suis TaxID=483139 RepID=A0A2C6LCZ8_9APIC|nr:hypothetical protein CSUI_000226 [Cystoisospora suis]